MRRNRTDFYLVYKYSKNFTAPFHFSCLINRGFMSVDVVNFLVVLCKHEFVTDAISNAFKSVYLRKTQ